MPDTTYTPLSLDELLSTPLPSGEPSLRVSPDVQRQRDVVAQNLRTKEETNSGLPTSALIPSDKPAQTPDEIKAFNQSISTPGKPNRGAAIAKEVKKEYTPIGFDDLSKMMGMGSEAPAKAAPKSETGETMKGLIGGTIGGNPKMFGAAIQGLGTIARSDWLKQQGEALKKLGEEKLANYQPAVGSIADVRTDSVANALGDFFVRYLPYQAGSALASMAPTIASGLLGAVAGGAVAGPGGAAAGGIAGTVLSGYPMNYGDIYSDALDDKGIQQAVKDGKLSHEDVARITAMAAVPITAIDSWSISRLGGQLFKDAKSALYKRIFNEMAAGSLREGTTEGLQQILSEFTQQQLGSDKTLAQQAISVIDNAIGGAAGGGITGGAAGAMQRSTPAQPEVVQTAAPAAPETPAVPRGTPIEPDGLPVQFPGAPTYTSAPNSLATQKPENPPLPLSPIDQARADAKVLQAGNPLDGDDTRFKNATLMSIYGENAAVRHVIEGPERFAAIGDAMMAVAPMVERVRGTMEAGQEQRDITPEILGAIDEFTRMKDNGHTIADVVAHGVSHDISYEAQQFIQFLDDHADNPEKIAGFLESYLHEVEKLGGTPSQVRGNAFAIIDQQREEREAEAEKAKQEAFAKTEKAANLERRETERKARFENMEDKALIDVVKAKVAGSGINKEHMTAIELAFANAKKLKGKKDGTSPESGGGVSQGPSGSAQAGGGRPEAKTGDAARPVSKPAETRVQGNARSNGAKGDGRGAAEKSNRGQAIIDEKKQNPKPPLVVPVGEGQGALPANAPRPADWRAKWRTLEVSLGKWRIAGLNNANPISPSFATEAQAEVWADNESSISPVDAGAHEAATSPKNELPAPTEAQIQAGNYTHGHANVGGLDISVENPAGSKRRPEWPVLFSHYGYFKGVPARAPDKEHVDVFVKPGTPEDYNGPVFVVDQNKANGHYDEPKIMLGHATQKEARAAYLKNYAKGWEKRIRGITEMTMGQFKEKLQNPDAFMSPQSKPIERAEPRLNIPADLTITIPVQIEETGEARTETLNARSAYRSAEKRVSRLTSLRDCLAR